MATELGMCGFGTAPFDYPLLDIPTVLDRPRTNYRYQPPATPAATAAPQIDSDESEVEVENESEDSDDRPPKKVRRFSMGQTATVDSDEDIDNDAMDTDSEEEAAAAADDDDGVGNYDDEEAGARGLVKGFDPQTRHPSTRIPFSLLRLENYDTPPITGSTTEPFEPWPTQFDSEFYSKAGFIYKEPTNISASHLISKTSIARACRLYGIKAPSSGCPSRWSISGAGS